MSILADFHMHTHHSGDSEAPMKDMIESAINKGLTHICFTEHHDSDYPTCYDLPDLPFILDPVPYREEYLRYKEAFAGKINIGFGVEIGMQTQIAKENLAFVKEQPYDFVIASQHLVDKRDPFYPDFWDPDTVDNIFKRFFDLTLENMKLFPDFDVLGHLDYIARYVPEGDTTYCYERYSEKIDRILLWLIENEKGLDVNSKVLASDSTLPPNPHPDILKRYRELGGRIITFGSDAHSPGKVACGFDKLEEIALSCGFNEYYTYSERKPVVHKLT